MSTASLSADPAKLRGVSQKTSRRNELLYDFFHLYSFFICMASSSVWLFHLYGFFTCMAFSSVWGFLAYGFCPWVLPVGFARGFCPWVLPVGFHLWVLLVGFHLWVFICGFSSVSYFICELFHMWVISSVDFFCGVCERSMRAKHFYDETVIIWMLFCNAKLVYIII
jgi:hypothetical protein